MKVCERLCARQLEDVLGDLLEEAGWRGALKVLVEAADLGAGEVEVLLGPGHPDVKVMSPPDAVKVR